MVLKEFKFMPPGVFSEKNELDLKEASSLHKLNYRRCHRNDYITTMDSITFWDSTELIFSIEQ